MSNYSKNFNNFLSSAVTSVGDAISFCLALCLFVLPACYLLVKVYSLVEAYLPSWHTVLIALTILGAMIGIGGFLMGYKKITGKYFLGFNYDKPLKIGKFKL